MSAHPPAPSHATMSAHPDTVDGALPNRDLEPKSEDIDAEHDDAKPKKKRRVIKILDKKYECSAEGCNKSYSRAEHLYRHQLNHTPKQIYQCDHPGCDRSFVRADLCTRHRERHTSKNSHLRRRDEFNANARSNNAAQNSDSPTGSSAMNGSPANSSHANGPSARPDAYLQPAGQNNQAYSEHYQNPGMAEMAPMQSGAGMAVDPHLNANAGSYNAYAGQLPNNAGSMATPTSPNSARRFNYDAEYARTNGMTNGYPQQQQQQPQPQPQQQQQQQSMHQAQQLGAPQTSAPMYGQPQYASPTAGNQQQFRSPNNYTAPIQNYATAYGQNNARPGNAMADTSMNGRNDYQIPTSSSNNYMEFADFEQMYANFPNTNILPVFGGGVYHRTPPTLNPYDDLFSLLDANSIDLNLPPSPPLPSEPLYLNTPVPPIAQLSKTEGDSTAAERSEPQSATAALLNGMDIDLQEIAIDDKIQKRLIKLVRSFEESEPLPGRRAKEHILLGDTNDQKHALSIRMLKTALMSYWIHIHQQMPIMHRPTFQPRTCPDLLLLTMICLGGSCLERTHPTEVAANVSELAFFAAYHIRWAVFKDAEFRPTAKLWTFQTMLLLELFEKMYSTRALHERAHIHHATTLTVMRRGSSLIGRALEIPGDSDPTRTPPGPEGSINTSGHNTTDARWNRWITAEATRRVAFAAFVIDSTHATLFGHSAVMSPHDMRLQLPCDEALWAATSSNEVQRVEASLAANGFKTLTFLEGLKRTLNGQKVRTNTFGRVILMAGLLNVSWHMNQRDLQVSSLGAKETLGNPTRWRSPLTRAFDFWRKDFDESLQKSAEWQESNPAFGHERDSVYESRTCLHSLAHMAMHVDIVDCEVFAGSNWALGRAVTDSDRSAVQRRLREDWAPSARARDAVFYALRFLCEVLIPAEDLQGRRANPNQPLVFTYSARDDYLLNRPWVLYFACMIVWSYGYALDGPMQKPQSLPTRELQIADMQRYLIRVGGVASPDDLEQLQDRNQCLGLLLLLRECFAQPRWELLHEARDMLGLCIEQLMPGNTDYKNN